MKITYKLVFTLLSFFIFSISFSQNTTEKPNDFDVIKLRSILKKRGVADKDLPKEINAFRTRQQKISRAYQTKKISSKRQTVQKKSEPKNTNAPTLRTAVATNACVISPNDRWGYIMLSDYKTLIATPFYAAFSGTGIPADVYTYKWSIFDPQSELVLNSTDDNISYTPTLLGDYEILLEITDQNGCTTTYYDSISSRNQCGMTDDDRAFGIYAPGDYSNYTTLLPINQTYDLNAYFSRGREDYYNFTYDWKFYSPDSVLIARGNNPVFPITLSVPGYHKVFLDLTDNVSGCTTSNSKIIGSLLSSSCTDENPKSGVIKEALLNVVKKLIARSLMGETDQQINSSGPDADYNALLPYLKNNTGTSFYNFTTTKYQDYNEGYLADLKFSFSSNREYDVHFNFTYGIYPYNPEYETVEELYDRIMYELYVNTTQYTSYNEQLNSCYMNILSRMSNISPPIFDPNDCRSKSEIINIDFCPSNCDPVTGIIKIIKDTGYPFQFSNSGITSVLACNETTFPYTFYAASTSLEIGTQLYLDAQLQNKLGSGNAWRKEGVDGSTIRIANDGTVAEFSDCGQPATTTYSFRAAHPLGHTGRDYIRYIDASGNEVEYEFTRYEGIVGPCEEIIARSILYKTGLHNCTSSQDE